MRNDNLVESAIRQLEQKMLFRDWKTDALYGSEQKILRIDVKLAQRHFWKRNPDIFASNLLHELRDLKDGVDYKAVWKSAVSKAEFSVYFCFQKGEDNSF